MGTPENVAAEKHFTPPTLTKMIRDALWEPQNDAQAKALEELIVIIKTTFKEWLRTVGLPQQMSEESTRQLLITMVDEP